MCIPFTVTKIDCNLLMSTFDFSSSASVFFWGGGRDVRVGRGGGGWLGVFFIFCFGSYGKF